MKRYPIYLLSVLVVATVVVGLAACGDDDADGEETGTVTGKITAADGETPIPGVTIEATSDTTYSAETRVDGTFEIAVPAEENELFAYRGNFSATIEFELPEEGPLELDPEPLESDAPMGFVPGEYDSIEFIVMQELGYMAEPVLASQLPEADLSDYGILFLNCGMDHEGYDSEALQAAIENITSFVEEGGTVYSSDLTLPFIRGAFPDYVLDSDEQPEGDHEGIVQHDDVASWFDESETDVEVQLHYDADNWHSIGEISEAPTVLIEGTSGAVDGQPLAIQFQPEGADGMVVHTTFHNTAVVTDDQSTLLRYYVFADSSDES